MKVAEVLAEAKQLTVDIDKITSQVKRNCQPFLSQVMTPMWRGLAWQQNKDVIFGTVETQGYRSPRDTPPIINTYMMSWLKEKSGIPFRQQHTLFGTGSETAARAFGIPFMAFPIGDFEYCWSPNVRDLTDQFHGMTGKSLTANQIATDVYDVMDSSDYQFNVGLDQALKSYKEVMIYCKSYYIFDPTTYLLSIGKHLTREDTVWYFQDWFQS